MDACQQSKSACSNVVQECTKSSRTYDDAVGGLELAVQHDGLGRGEGVAPHHQPVDRGVAPSVSAVHGVQDGVRPEEYCRLDDRVRRVIQIERVVWPRQRPPVSKPYTDDPRGTKPR